MAEWSSNAEQLVNPGESIVFTDNPVPCNLGLIRHRDGTGNFLLSGSRGCPCSPSANYFVDFGANIAIPTGETVGEISLAITVDGATIPSSQMIVTPAAVEEYANVSRAISVPIWRGCCQTVTVQNTSDIPISVQNTNIVFDRPDLR